MNQTFLSDIVRVVKFAASIEKVWDAVATSEGLAMWLMPNDFKPVLGHEFTFVARGDYQGLVPCKVIELTPPQTLKITWAAWTVSFNLVKLNDVETEMTLVHSGWTQDQEAIREKMYEGWGHLTEALQEKLGDEYEGIKH